MKRKHLTLGTICMCSDCDKVLMMRCGLLGQWHGDWFMAKASVWRASQRKGRCRFLCVGCLEGRLGRKLTAVDFQRSAKVNFFGQKSQRLRARMRGLRPAKRLINT